MDTTARLAASVADAADAWLKDPQDSNVYRLLVAATLRWREHQQPQLPLVGPDELAADVDTGPLPATLGESVREVAAILRGNAVEMPQGQSVQVDEPR